VLFDSITIKAQNYNPDAAAAYAQQWCNSYNLGAPTYYRNYTGDGGDCANFVSQCLIAGGLDLSAGTNGRGAYVKPEGVIAGATQLIQHLKSYQKTEYAQVHGCKPPASHDVGDPMFIMSSTNSAEGFHSYFCSSLDVNANRLYSAHTGFACDANTNSYYSSFYRTYFHIKNSIPAHCENCIKDGDETGRDCGGSCPPCQHAPENKVYTVANESQRLPAETYAISNITARDAVTVVAGSTVAFFTAGSVDLLPGFEARQGSDFTVQIKKKRLEATADCNAYCDPEFDGSAATSFENIPELYINNGWLGYYPDALTYDGTITNAAVISIQIYQIKTKNFTQNSYKIYESTFVPAADGLVTLWNLRDGTPHYTSDYVYSDVTNSIVDYWFVSYLTIISCQGEAFTYTNHFWVLDAKPSGRRMALNDTLNYLSEEETQSQMDFADLFFLYPNPTSGTLTIGSSEPLQAFSDLTLVNSSGQTVYGQKYLDNFTLSLPALPNGEYILSVWINRQPVSRKVILQR
jgi:hypothetical protein